MARRVSLPAADHLFRPTAPAAAPTAKSEAAPAGEEPARGPKKPSGRVRHDEKMTVYVTSDELLEIEHARLALRSGQGLAVDRGRLVRVAISLALADYEANGEASELVRRLTEE